jgi:hypothetical protein
MEQRWEDVMRASCPPATKLYTVELPRARLARLNRGAGSIHIIASERCAGPRAR